MKLIEEIQTEECSYAYCICCGEYGEVFIGGLCEKCSHEVLL